MISSATQARPVDTAITQPVASETVIVLPLRAEVKVLNAVGARVWTLLDGQHTLHQVALAIATEFGISPEQAESDVLAFAEQLYRRGMIEV